MPLGKSHNSVESNHNVPHITEPHGQRTVQLAGDTGDHLSILLLTAESAKTLTYFNQNTFHISPA